MILRERKNEIIVGLDVGTTKICVLVARVLNGDELHTIAIGLHPSQGMRKGTVVDIQRTSSDIRSAILKAQTTAGREITSAIVGVTGKHISSHNVRGAATITNYKGQITEEDIERALQNAEENLPITKDRKIIHITTRQFIVDGEEGVQHPEGMFGQHLEVEAHIVTGSSSFIQNLLKAVELAGIKVEELLLQPIATAEAVLEEAEKDIGVALLDIGGGTTDLAIFKNGSVCFSSSIPVGGNHLSSDIMVGLRTTIEEAERLKQEKGHAIASLIDPQEPIEVKMVARSETKLIPRRILAEIIEARLTELFHIVAKEISRAKVGDTLPGGIVLTGGTSLLPGIDLLAEKVLNMPARVGYPKGIRSLPELPFSPVHATAVGLVLYAFRYGYAHPKRLLGKNPLARLFLFFYNLFSKIFR
ncbi:cell division protein FtsA [bacterium]|nr:cell division protein FtsA [bacterium]